MSQNTQQWLCISIVLVFLGFVSWNIYTNVSLCESLSRESSSREQFKQDYYKSTGRYVKAFNTPSTPEVIAPDENRTACTVLDNKEVLSINMKSFNGVVDINVNNLTTNQELDAKYDGSILVVKKPSSSSMPSPSSTSPLLTLTKEQLEEKLKKAS